MSGEPFNLQRAVPLSHALFDREPDEVAPDLLGCVLASTVGGQITAGRIVETEAYLGSGDPGSHAATKGITKRNAVLYAAPGTVYVYFTYGNHHMVNLVCSPAGRAGAVLVRALEPLLGIEVMAARRHGRPTPELANGPGKLAAALGVDLSDNGALLGSGRLQVYHGERSPDECVGVSGRIGLSAGHDLDLRFYIEGNAWVSRARTGPVGPKSARRRGAERRAT